MAHAAQTGKTPPALLLPPMPPGCQVLWTTFLQLHASRGSSGNKPSAISFMELVAWQQLTGVELNPWEIEVLQALDRVALTASASP